MFSTFKKTKTNFKNANGMDNMGFQNPNAMTGQQDKPNNQFRNPAKPQKFTNPNVNFGFKNGIPNLSLANKREQKQEIPYYMKAQPQPQPQPQPQNYPPINLINPFLKPPTDSSNVSSEYARQAQDTMRFVYNSWDKLADKDRENSQEILKEMYPDFDISKKNYERLLRSQNPDSIRAEKERDELLEILNDAYSGFDNLSLAEQKDKVKFLEMMYPDYDTSREKYETYISSKKTENANKNKNSLNEILAIYANLHKAKNNGYMQNNNYMQNNGFGTAKIPTQYGMHPNMAGGESKFDNNMNKRTGRLKPGLTVAYEGTNAGSGYGGIYNSYEYVNSKYNNGYKSKDWGTLDKDMPKFLMNTFEKNVNNCTLTAITRVLSYHRDKHGLSNLPADDYELYRMVKAVAENYGYDGNDTGFTKINNIVTDLLRKYSYEGKGNSDYALTWNAVTREIDHERPFLLNISSGYYENHTVTVVGYSEFTNGWNTRHFLKVHDGWTNSDRYIDWEAFGMQSFGSFTKIPLHN